MKQNIFIVIFMLMATVIQNRISCHNLDKKDPDKELIAKVLHHECCQKAGQPYSSQVLLMSCILNRVKLGKKEGYGNSVREVIHQKGQFSGVANWAKPCESCLKASYSRFKVYPKVTHYYAPKYAYEGYENLINKIITDHGHVYGTWK